MNQMVDNFDRPSEPKANKESEFGDIFPDPGLNDLPRQVKSPVKPPRSPEKKKIKMVRLRDQEKER